MSVKAWIAFPIVLLILVGSTGCRFKSPDSFISATTVRPTPDKVIGDKYANGGIGDATGGTKDATQYGVGAKKGAGTVMNTERDFPAKGSGTRPGEDPGTGHGNGPVYQSSPSNFQASTGGNRG
jgi:hypothetical protein